jgi:hypothetical protein
MVFFFLPSFGSLLFEAEEEALEAGWIGGVGTGGAGDRSLPDTFLFALPPWLGEGGRREVGVLQP